MYIQVISAGVNRAIYAVPSRASSAQFCQPCWHGMAQSCTVCNVSMNGIKPSCILFVCVVMCEAALMAGMWSDDKTLKLVEIWEDNTMQKVASTTKITAENKINYKCSEWAMRGCLFGFQVDCSNHCANLIHIPLQTKKRQKWHGKVILDKEICAAGHPVPATRYQDLSDKIMSPALCSCPSPTLPTTQDPWASLHWQPQKVAYLL